jgi:AcrR family transcriptional regulator
MATAATVLDLSVDRSVLPETEGVSETGVRILVAGLDLFATRGYHATSIRDIAAGCGLQSASLYGHFASKEAILAELVTTAYRVHNRALMSALLGVGSDPKDQLRKLVEAHVAAHCRWSKLAAVATWEISNLSEQAAAPAHVLRESSAALLVEIIDRGLTQKAFTIAHLDVTLSAIGSLGTAVINWYPTQAATYTPEQVGVIYADLTLLMVGATP